MASSKKVSVCINAYNCERFIAETIQSVLDQSYTNFEIIVVDDCSTDDTVKVVEGFNDDRITLVRLPENQNISGSNNEALKRATGDYIAHLDSDDVWKPNKLERQVKFLEEHPEYGACFSFVDVIDEHSYDIGDTDPFFKNLFNVKTLSQAQFLRKFTDEPNFICHSTMLLRRDIFEKLGYHNRSLLYLHDFDCWARLILICPIFIYPEPLINYRVRAGSNSAPGEDKNLAMYEEYARIVYNMIDNCPDELFLAAFADRLRLSGEHGKKQIELEKAFVLLDAFEPLKSNKYLGVRKLDELFSDAEYIEIAERDFGFGVRDLYELHKNEFFYNEAKFNGIKGEEQKLLEKIEEQQKEYELLEQKRQELENNYKALEGEYLFLESQYNANLNSIEMRLMKPVTLLKRIRNKWRNLFSKYTGDGRKSVARIMLYGFYGHNLGDDVFFDMLFKRYPDTLFYVLGGGDYLEFFSHYANVRFYDAGRPMIAKINRLGSKLGIDNLFEKILLSATDGAMHIGGSIYQQIADWENDLKVRKKRNRSFKTFFAISNNFGPYTTDGYLKFWRRQFKTFDDICFRDFYSYNLFSDIKTVRCAPDLLFSYKTAVNAPTEKRVAVSVIDPRFRVRSFTEEQAAGYENKMIELIEYYVEKGYEVSMLGFCTLEEDNLEIDRLYERLSENAKEHVRRLTYHDSIDEIMLEIRKSEKVIATRFHAMILGYIFGKKVLPIIYSDKMSNVIDDLGLCFDKVRLEKLSDFSCDDLDLRVRGIYPEEVRVISSEADRQFEGFDRYIEHKNGEIVR
ncbi:MAG: glycosyltransferase [Clostridia bacterium]|nr:glycosyltransferase [Clostridia bacterium]